MNLQNAVNQYINKENRGNNRMEKQNRIRYELMAKISPCK